jgi:hypothetical protein
MTAATTPAAITAAAAFVRTLGATAVRNTSTARRNLITFTLDTETLIDSIPAIRGAQGFRFVVTNTDGNTHTHTVEV